MRNSDEHKKLLSKVQELAKNSINHFDVEKEFFLIDSNNLAKIETRFYGYSIQATGIYEQDNLTEEAIAGLDGRGCYVYVEVKDGHITIKQDLNGSWGLYLFRTRDYFALSNSFFRLVDHIKFRYSLTINRDYVYYQVTDNLCSITCSDTVINEIHLIDRSAILHIDIKQKTLDTELIDYKKYTVPLDSEKGIAILDRWVKFWGDVFRNVVQRTKFFQADLSGGFDTRISFALLLNSGIDLNEIRVYSIEGTGHTLEEDYEIASKIAEHYGFKLNRPFSERQFLNFSIADVFNADLYINQTFSNLPRFKIQKSINKIYCLGGTSGETLRFRWQILPEELMNKFTWKANPYSPSLSREISASIKNILEASLLTVRHKHKVKYDDSKVIQQLVYHETWSRHHFGKDCLCNYFAGNVRLSPPLDPEVRTLSLNTAECPDNNLLMTLLFTRYEPDLLNFPIDLNRSIAPETLEYARKLNECFPRNKTVVEGNRRVFHLQPRDTEAEKILSSGKNNPKIPDGLPQACLKAVFESGKTYGLFTSYFDEELYHYAASYYDKNIFGRYRLLYSIVGVARALEDVELSRPIPSLYRDMQRFLEQDFVTIRANDDAEIITKFKPYITGRVDVKLMVEGNLKILNVSDGKAVISKPEWFNKDGPGYVIQSYAGKLEFTAKAEVAGQIRFFLRSLDIREPADRSKRIPYWIDYTKLIIKGKTLFDTVTPIWHDKAYRYETKVKAGEEVTVSVEWLPHHSNT